MQIISISGKKSAGKDTVGNLLLKHLSPHINITKLSFAGALKEICCFLFNWDLDRLTNDEAYKAGNTLDDGSPDPACEMLGMNRREIMQKVGTEAMRDGLHPDIWIIVIKLAELNGKFDNVDIGFIPDARFFNELNFCRSKGGWTVRVDRPGSDEADQHLSEQEWTRWTDWDKIIANDSDLDALEAKVVEFVNEILERGEP